MSPAEIKNQRAINRLLVPIGLPLRIAVLLDGGILSFYVAKLAQSQPNSPARRTQKLDRPPLDILSEGPSLAAAPRLQQRAVPLKAELIRLQLSSLHTPFVCITQAVVEKSEIYDGRRQVFVEWEDQIQRD